MARSAKLWAISADRQQLYSVIFLRQLRGYRRQSLIASRCFWLNGICHNNSHLIE
ncbi:hypothetical protein J2W42_005566 [Rhizobium tibeticum]|nr:hypothetical protein [Rhizobium tibeticum]